MKFNTILLGLLLATFGLGVTSAFAQNAADEDELAPILPIKPKKPPVAANDDDELAPLLPIVKPKPQPKHIGLKQVADANSKAERDNNDVNECRKDILRDFEKYTAEDFLDPDGDAKGVFLKAKSGAEGAWSGSFDPEKYEVLGSSEIKNEYCHIKDVGVGSVHCREWLKQNRVVLAFQKNSTSYKKYKACDDLSALAKAQREATKKSVGLAKGKSSGGRATSSTAEEEKLAPLPDIGDVELAPPPSNDE